MGAHLGYRRRRRNRRVRDLPCARRPHDRHLGERGEARAGTRVSGADVAVNHHEGDVVAAVKEATGKGVHVVVETVGDATWARSLAALRPAGHVAVCGATSGPNPPAALHRFWWKQLTLHGSTMGTREDFLGAYELIRSGRARVHIDASSRSRRSPPPTSASRPASSSARSSSRSRADAGTRERVC